MPRSADTPPVEPRGPAPGGKGENEGFLTRWSRRKRAAREGQSDDASAPPATTPQPVTLAEAPSAEPRLLADEDLPPVESLDENADYSAFLSPKVSEELRQVALRKLFHLPEFNVRDGLDDYDEDYTTFTELGDLVPHDMKRMFEREQKRELAADAQLEPRIAPDPQVEPGTEAAPNEPDHASLSAVAEADSEAVDRTDGTGSKSA